MLYYEHMGYASVYEKELGIKIKNGFVSEVAKYDNSKTNISYLNSDKLSKFVIRQLNKEILDTWDSDLKAYVNIKAIQRKVKSVTIASSNRPELNDELVKIIGTIEDWDILYRHGEPAELGWIYPIIITIETIEIYGR